MFPDDLLDPVEQARVFEALFQVPSPKQRIGRYVVLGTLGRGGMGTVLEAFDRALDRRVAIKVLHRDLGPQQQQRLEREAQALAKLSHPNVVQIYEVGESDGRAFIAMEMVEGQSLRAWMQQDPAPRWRDCVDVYLQVGRGLAAAHARGLIHRDFKPDNALVGSDGRVRVADFGLARTTRESESEGSTLVGSRPADDEPSPGSGPMASLTKAGAIVGTIAYMAPEQMMGRVVDARADQFSFCVALYEAIYGERPYDAGSLMARVLVLGGGLSEPKTLTSAPRWVHRVLRRGLELEPERRFDGMDALLAALLRPQKRRRRWISGLLMAGSAAVAAAAALAWGPPLCEIDQSALTGTWDDQRRAQVREAFEATGLALAAPTLAASEGDLDRWGEAWIDAQREACEATRVLGVQSEALLDRRTACLDRKRRELGALVGVLEGADERVVARSAELLAALPDLGSCAEPPAEPFARPQDPEREARLIAAEDRLARARPLLLVGELDEVETIVSEVEADVEALDYTPLAIERRFVAGELLLSRHELEEGAAVLSAAAREAAGQHLDELSASIMVRLARRISGRWSKPSLESWVVADAESALVRVGRPDDPRALELRRAQAKLACQSGDHEDALAILREAHTEAQRIGALVLAPLMRTSIADELSELGRIDEARAAYVEARGELQARFGDRTPLVASIEHDLGILELEVGDFTRAREHLARSRAIFGDVLGPEAVEVARVDLATAKLYVSTGELERALATIEALLPVFERDLGPNHRQTGEALAALGVLRYFSGDFPGSILAYERALSIASATLGAEHQDVGQLHSNIGESRLALGDHEGALVELEHALSIIQRTLPTGHRLLVFPLMGRGLALLALGRATEAIDDLERAQTIAAASESDPIELARIRFGLARALRDSGREPARSRELALQARRGFAELGLDEHLTEIDTWIDQDSTTQRERNHEHHPQHTQ